MNNLVSIIIPVYKTAKTVQDAVYSVTCQTYSNLEIILVDDGSPDEAPAICDSLAQADTRIKVIHKPNGGLSDARNVGIAAASGDIIGFLDSDDTVQPEMVETMLNAMLSENTDIACCCVRKVYSDHEVVQEFPRNKIYSKRKAMYELINSRELESFAWNKLYKRAMLGDSPFPVGRVFEDMLAMPAIFQKANKVIHINTCLYNYVRRDDSILGTWNLDTQAEFTRAHQDRYLEVQPIWPEFGPLMMQRYVSSLRDLCNRALVATSEEIKSSSELLSTVLYQFYKSHRSLIEPYTTEDTRKKYDVLLGRPSLFSSLWPTVRKVRTALYDFKHR